MGASQFWIEKCNIISPEKNSRNKTPNTTPQKTQTRTPCLLRAFTAAVESSSFLFPFPTASVASSCPVWCVFPLMPDMSYIVHKLHLGFINNLLFHIVFLFHLTSVIIQFFNCHCFSQLSKDSRCSYKGQPFTFCKTLLISRPH